MLGGENGMQILIDKGYVNSEELKFLLNARKEGKTNFILVDVREDIEFKMGHIKGIDFLKNTSSFGEWAQTFLEETKEKVVVLTCRTGNRSAKIQNIFKQHGHKGIINHYGGIVSYRGEIET